MISPVTDCVTSPPPPRDACRSRAKSRTFCETSFASSGLTQHSGAADTQHYRLRVAEDCGDLIASCNTDQGSPHIGADARYGWKPVLNGDVTRPLFFPGEITCVGATCVPRSREKRLSIQQTRAGTKEKPSLRDLSLALDNEGWRSGTRPHPAQREPPL